MMLITSFLLQAALAGSALRAPAPATKAIGLSGHADSACVCFSPDERLVATGDGYPFEPGGMVRLWETETGTLRTTLKGHSAGVCCLTFHPGGKVLASGANDGEILLWDAGTGRRLAALSGHRKGLNSLAFSPDGSLLASAGEDGTVRLWDLKAGKQRQVLKGHEQAVRAVAFSPDGRLLASGGMDFTARLWDVAGGKETATLRPAGGVWALGFRDAKTLVIGTWGDISGLVGRKEGTMKELMEAMAEGEVGVWDIPSERRLTSFRKGKGHVDALDIKPGRRFAAWVVQPNTMTFNGWWGSTRLGTAEEVFLWDTEEDAIISVPHLPRKRVRTLALSSSGKWLAVATSGDGTVRLWKVRKLLEDHGKK